VIGLVAKVNALDRVISGWSADDLRTVRGLPDCQLAVLPGTSHEGMLDRIDWLQSMILGFLGAS
jgi:hypothetical protein